MLRISCFVLILFNGFLGSAGPACGQFPIQGPQFRLNGVIFAVAVQPDGKVLLGGSFDDFDGTDGNGLIRLNSNGTKDQSFDIGFIDGVSDLLVLGDFVYVAGGFTQVRTKSLGVLARQYLFRINLIGPNTGKIDASWTPVLDGSANVLASDGTDLYVAGDFTQVGGQARARLAKILLSGPNAGQADGSWNPAPNNKVKSMLVATAGAQGAFLYVSGDFLSVGGIGQKYLARLSLTGAGAADPNWDPIPSQPSGAIGTDGVNLYVGGGFTSFNGVNNRRGLVRLSLTAPDAFDTAWNPDPDGEVTSMAIIGSDIYYSGVFKTVTLQPRFFLAKSSTVGSGVVDGAFVPNPNGAVLDMAAGGGGLIVGGRFTTTTGAASRAFARLSLATGAADPAFAGSVSTLGQIYKILGMPDGKVMVGGLFDTVDGVPRVALARLNANGTLDTGFDLALFGYNPRIYDFERAHGFLYFCGDFLRASGTSFQHVARVSETTYALDTVWKSEPNTPILCLAADSDYLYLGSRGLSRVLTTSVFNVARLSKTGAGALDTTWRPAATVGGNPYIAGVFDMVYDGTALIIGGDFTFVTTPPPGLVPYQRISLARIETSGANSGVPSPGYGSIPTDLSGAIPRAVDRVILASGSLYVSGEFQRIDGIAQYYVAKFNPSTGAWDQNFYPDPDLGDPYRPGTVSDLAADANYIYLAGSFQAVFNGTSHTLFPYLARVDKTTGVLDQSWDVWSDNEVSRIAFVGNDLWISGLFRSLVDQSVDQFAIIRPFSAGYNSWLNTYFTPAQRAISSYTALFQDIDGDGLSNLVEFAFNLNPFEAKVPSFLAGATAGLPFIRAENIGGRRLTIEYPRWNSATNPGISYSAEFVNSLTGAWSARGGTPSVTPTSNANIERVRVEDSVANQPSVFGRVKITLDRP